MARGARKPSRAARRKRRDVWRLTDAKARFSELFECAQEAPQRVSRHDKDEVVILSGREYARLCRTGAPKTGLVDFLSGLQLAELDLDRPPFERDVEL
jgi:prevent-host-death family protein